MIVAEVSMFGRVLRGARYAVSWVGTHKAASIALALPVVGIGVSAAVLARQRARHRKLLAHLSARELDGLTQSELEEIAARLERAHREGEVR
jgi:hypothetical protein